MSDRNRIPFQFPGRRFAKSSAGTASVEFALLVFALVVMLFGTIEIGRLWHDYQVASKGVRDGGRYLSKVEIDCSGGPGTSGTISTTPVNHDQRARNLIMTGSVDAPTSNDDYLLLAWAHPDTTLNFDVDCNAKGTLGGIYAGDVVPSINVISSIHFNFLGSMPGLPVSIKLPIKHKEIGIGE